MRDDLVNKLRDLVRRGDCGRCGAVRAALLHAALPSLCARRPPPGGWREPHKNEL